MAEQQLLFDKLAYIDRLTRAGIGEHEARAHAEAMEEALRESVATRTDIAQVRTDITRLSAEIAHLETSTIARLRSDLENKIEIAVRDTTIRTGAMLIALFSALVAIEFFGSAG